MNGKWVGSIWPDHGKEEQDPQGPTNLCFEDRELKPGTVDNTDPRMITEGSSQI